MSGDELRALSQSVQQASDQQIIQVVAAIDRIENRGDADKLLAPLRGRIAAMGIKRPLTLRRLTYEPLEPLIVNNAEWVSGQPAVPRSALISLFDLIRAESPDMIDWEQLAPAAQFNRRMREELGMRLWGRGAQVLAAAGMPGHWQDLTGLSAEDFNRISGIVALVLGQARNLRRLDALRGEDYNDPLLRQILAAALEASPLSLQAMLAILIGNHELLPLVARLGQEVGSPLRHAEARAGAAVQITATLRAQFTRAIDGGMGLRALADVADTIGELEAVAGQGDLRQAAGKLREDVKKQCEAALDRLVGEILPVLRGASPDQRGLEAQMRKLRVLGMICERFGDAAGFEAAVEQAAAVLADSALPLVSRARLLEQLGCAAEARKLVKPDEDVGEEEMAGGWSWPE